MFSFNTKNFEFFSYDFNNEMETSFLKELINDESTNKYIKNINALINKEGYNPLRNAYLVGKDNEIVGYINLYEKLNIIDIDIAVGPRFRGIKNNSNETIGCQILKDVSEYLFDNYIFIRYLRAMIAKSNNRSIKTVTNAGFKYIDSYFEGEEYRKYHNKRL